MALSHLPMKENALVLLSQTVVSALNLTDYWVTIPTRCCNNNLVAILLKPTEKSIRNSRGWPQLLPQNNNHQHLPAITQPFHGVDKYQPICGMDKHETLELLHPGNLPKTRKRHNYLGCIRNPVARRLQALITCST